MNTDIQNILAYLKQKPTATQKEMAEHFNVTKRAIERNMNNLKEKGYIERIGNNHLGYWKILK